MNQYPLNHVEGQLFLYVYTRKGACHIRVTSSLYTMDPEYSRAFDRRAYTVEEAAALGLDLDFLQKYYAASRAYFHARMGMNQNRPCVYDIADELTALIKEDVERVRKYRYAEAKRVKHRAWSDLAILRKTARAALGPVAAKKVETSPALHTIAVPVS